MKIKVQHVLKTIGTNVMQTLEQGGEGIHHQHHTTHGEGGRTLTSDPSSRTFSSCEQLSLLTLGPGGAGEGGAQHQ